MAGKPCYRRCGSVIRMPLPIITQEKTVKYSTHSPAACPPPRATACLWLWISFLVLLLAFAYGGVSRADETKPSPIAFPPRSVYGTAPPVTLLIYSLDPQLLAGWNFPLGGMAGLGMSASPKYILPAERKLPILGGWDPGDTPQLGKVLDAHPRLALLWAPYLDRPQIHQELQRIGVPTAAVQLASLDDYPAAFRELGKKLGVKGRGGQLAEDFQQILSRLRQIRAQIPVNKRKRVYYAEGIDGLMTDSADSPHTQVIRAAGGANVFTATPTSLKGMQRVSLGQVLAWNPTVILVQDPIFYQRIYSLPAWKAVRAVQTHQVYLIPRAPFNWMDRPPSFMMGIGSLWLADLLYPQQAKIDITQETIRFFYQFLHVRLSPKEAKAILRS